NATVELAHDKSKLELKDTEATITAGDNAGSIKITSNGDKKIELSPENGAKLTLEKDSTTNSGSNYVKATGLSSVGVDETTALIFKNNGSKSAELKVGASTTYKFTESGLDLGNKKLTALASGLNLNSAGTSGNGNEEIIKKILEGNPDGMTSGSNSTSIANNAVNVKDLSQVAKAIVQKGLTFAGNTGGDIKAALGDKITIKGEGTYLTSTAKTSNGSKEIEFSLTKTVTDKLDIITVKDGSDSFALGKNSKIVDKKTAPKGIIPNVGGNSVKITWEHAGTSKSTGSQDMKSVVSVGDTDKERIITHVAAGEVRDGSTDAVNAGQLYSVIEVFGKLGTDVLGAEKNDSGDGFKKTTFTKLMSGDGANGTAQTPAPMTFKDAIEKNIAKINEGLKFKGDTGAEFTRQLGATVMIKGDGTDLTSKAENGTITFELHKSDKVSASDQKVVTSKAVDTAIKDIKLSYKANGDTATKQVKLTDGLHFKDGTNTTAVVEESGVVKFSLNEELKNITSISGKSNSGTTPKIEFANGGNGLNPNIKISANGGEFTFDNNGLILNDKQIKGVKSGLGLNGTSGNGTDKSIIEKVLSGNPDGTTAGSNGTSIANNAINAQDLSTVAKALLDKGLTFKVDNGTSADSSTKTEMTKALGQAVTFKGDGKYLTTKLNDTNGEISFNLSVAESISDTSTGGDSTQNTTNSKLVTENAVKNFVTHKINNLSSTLQLEGDNSNSKDFGKVELKTQKLKLAGEADEIVTEVTKDDPSVKIKLAQKVKDKLAIINVGENTNGDNSFALGKDSKLETKKTAPSGIIPNAGTDEVKFSWTTAGASKTTSPADMKEVISVGNTNVERIITHVAAGNVADGSTDAINGGQLKSVIDVFANLGISVLGAEKAEADKDGFKQSTFTAVQYKRDTQEQAKAKETFKGAIDETIIAINKGLKFDGNSGGPKDLKLGDTLTIKGTDTVASSAGTNSAPHRNITTTAKDGGILEIALNQDLKGISSISGKKGSGSAVAKIDFTSGGTGSGTSTSPTVKITAGTGTFTFGENGLSLNSKQITGIASGLGLTEASNTHGGNSDTTNKGIIDKVLNGTIVTQNGTKNNAVNVKDLSEVAKSLVKKGLSFEGNSGGSISRKLGETLKIVGETSPTTDGSTQPAMETAADNIIVAKKKDSEDTLEVKLSKNLKGIGSVANGENAKIALGGNGNDKTITFTSGDTPETVTLKGRTLSGVSEINKEEGKGALKLTENTATLESAKDNSKVELKDKAVTLESAKDNSKLELKDKAVTLESTKDGSSVTLDGTSATLSAGKNKGSIKVTNGADNKIELSPENGSTVMLKKDMTNGGVQATGLSTIGKDNDNALVFKNSTSGTDKTAELKVGGSALTFTKATTGNTVKISNVEDGKIDTSSTEAITGKQLADLATHLGVRVKDDNGKKIAFEQPKFDIIKGGTKEANSGTTTATGPTTFKGAIEQLITAVNGGLTFKGNDNTPTQTTLQLGGTLTIDSSTVGNGTTGAAGKTEKDITVTLAPSNGNNPQSAGTLTLKLNKADKVDENDGKVVTSKAVATELKKYTTTADLDKGYLKVDGSNIGSNQKTFGNNVGIAEIKLGDSDKSDTELVQAKALIGYLKGKGTNSVKISDSPETKAEGEGSIAVGDKAIAQNTGAVAIGQNAGAKHNGAISIGKGSDVTGENGIAIGKGTTVSGQSSMAIGETNTVSGVQSYVLGSDNTVKGKNVVAIGSNIKVENENIHDAVVLGNGSEAVSNAVSVGGSGKDKKRRIVYVDTPTDSYDAVNKKYVDDLTLSYKSNSTNKQTVKLTDGLDFNKSDNISVSVEADGKITHTLNNNLQEITSIKGGKDEQGAKIILSSDKKEIDFDKSKLKGISEGEIKDDSTDVITGKQLADLAKQLGIDVDDKTKTTFKTPTFDDFKLKGIDGKTTEPAPKNIVEGLKNAVTKLNEGLKFGGDIPSAGTNTNNTHYLGSTINIVRLASNTADMEGSKPSAMSANMLKISDYSGDNLVTQYRNEDGNAKIEIGFKNAPMFEKVTLSKPQIYGTGSGSTVEKNDLITKSYLDAALSDFKFTVEYNGKKVQLGRNDILKFTAGQNIQLTLAKDGKTLGESSSADSSSATATTPVAVAPNVSSGSAGTDGGNGVSSTASTGSAPSATPAPTPSQPTVGTQNGSDTSSMTSSTSSNTAPSSGTGISSNTTAEITIATTDELKNITSISSKPKDSGLNAGGNQDEVTKLTLDPNSGATFQVGTTGSKVNVNSDGISLTPQGANGANSSPVETPSIVIKAGAKSVDPSNLDSLDPNNGPSIAFSTKKTSDSKSRIGTGKITGLKDLDDKSTGDMATNKNYVDKQVEALNSNRPFDFYLDNEKVVKGKDGKFRKASELSKELTEEEVKKVVIKAEPTTAPIGISNVASGLGITTPTDEQKEKLNQLAEEVSEKVTALGEKMKDFSEKAEKFADLQLMVDSLKQTVDTMPDGEAKEKIRENLKKYETQLSDAQEAKKNAKEAVESARNELIEANGDYNAFSEAIAKVEELVEPDSQAELSNVATIADVQAVAKSGLKFKGNDGVEVRKQLSETLSITGEGTFNSDRTATGNIKVEMSQDGKGLEVKLSDQLKNMTSFETREVNGKKARLDSNGLRVVNKGKDGTDDKAKSATYGAEAVVLEDKNKSDKAVMTAGGIRFADSSTQATALSTELNKNGLTVNGAGGQIHIDGTKGVITVPNIKPNADGHVVVNKNYVDTKNNELRTQMNNNDRNMRAGVAQAVAQANLPVNILPGKSTLSLATGNYMGSQAFAVGYSRVSDNGKLSVKFSLGHGDKKTSVGAGVGYSW
ncbi:hypothetical protein E5361_08370, partial [Histophilus somni]|uniref:YadA-like family protein n=1 Tax=Histophilus somni TaxID=731 RepID=UPI00109C1E1E